MDELEKYYQGIYEKYGANDERSLGWTKNKMNVRFEQLLRFLNPQSGTLLDIGCGFADLYKYMADENAYADVGYYGVDIMQPFIDVAKTNHPDKAECFECMNFMEKEIDVEVAYCVGSGIFGHNLYDTEDDMYEYIESVIKRALGCAKVGVAFNFLSDKVDYRTSGADFHASPERILGIAYKMSRNVILDNSVMPFEFTLTIFKDDSFSTENTLFNSHVNKIL